MKIIISSQAFYPDHSGIPLYASDFAFYAARQGHDVNVISSFPFYPQWKKRPEDRRRLLAKEIVNGVKIYRGYTYTKSNPSTITRLIQEFWLFFFSAINYLRIGKPDWIIVFTTPVSFGWLGLIFKRIFGCKLFINVQDFQVEAASSLKMIKGGNGLLSMLRTLESQSYSGAEYVSTITHSMLDLLENKGVPRYKQILWPNWIDTNEDRYKENMAGEFRRKNGIGTEVVLVGYAGNIGLKQGLTLLIDLASHFKNNVNVEFYIIGEGSGLDDLVSYSDKAGSTNVRFLPFLDSDGYLEFLCDVDFVFISQMKTDADIYFPSKLLGIMLNGKPLILAADEDSELFKVLNENQLAYVCRYGDINTLSDHLNQALNEKTKTRNIVANAQNFVSQFDTKVVLDEILKLIGK